MEGYYYYYFFIFNFLFPSGVLSLTTSSFDFQLSAFLAALSLLRQHFQSLERRQYRTTERRSLKSRIIIIIEI